MDLPGLEPGELGRYYPEMRDYIGRCFYADCTHLHEPDCMVKDAVDSGGITKERYSSYSDIYRELNERRRY